MVLPESGSSCTEAVKLQSAASVLEAAMEYSPHNPHLKISALFVYSQLNAAPRAWELFHTLHIKHIQYESLSYLILPILWSGGMYIEAVSVCKDILRLQRAAAQDAGEFSGRAMDNGAFSKAEEFLRFHRRRMNRSLTCLEAKGIILEGAPLYVQEENQRPLGALQGIVGGPEDIDRAYEIVANVLDPFSAFSVLYLSTSANDASENRDFDVLEFEVLTHWPFASPENIVQETKRRGHVQSLLLRSALVKEVTKGPKKGKIVPPNESLRMRARSLLSYARSTKAFCDEADADPQTKISYHFLRMLILECQVLAVVSSGLNPDSPSEEAEDMLSREDVGCTLLYRICNGFEASRLPPLSIPMVSRMLPECIVPIFSLFSMCAEVCDLFGWGKRKRKSKKASEALARVALALSQVIDAMLIPLNR
jgi:N-terminal acetyltransferase B complex non-catalytic subunit